MRGRGSLAAAATIAATAALVCTAGASAHRAAAAKPDLTTNAGVAGYLRSLGIDPAGVVVQRGRLNYAGRHCPGRRWSCTTSRRVVQLTAHGGANRFECTDASEETNDCLVVQESPGGNTARCVEAVDDVTPASQSCTIVQTSVDGDNRAFVDQVVEQSAGSDQHATQDASVTQTSDSGKNDSHLSQRIEQKSKDKSLVVAQTQDGRQRASVDQTSTSGDQDSHLGQSTDQDANASKAMGGTQDLSGDLFATVDQHSAGISRNHNRQDEDQHASAPEGSAVVQTLIGPIYCCSDQGTDPRDLFDIDQSSTQQSTSPTAVLTEHVLAFCTTTGTCDARQLVNENGEHTTNTCLATGAVEGPNTCTIGITCVENECTPCEGFDCFPECKECIARGLVFRASTRVLAWRRF